MHFGPIFRALLRNKTGAILISLQVAFTLTVTLNAWVMIDDRMTKAARKSGVNEADSFHLQSYGFTKGFNNRHTIDEDLRNIRGFPGVAAAVALNAVPLSGSGWSSGVRPGEEEDSQSYSAAMYMVDEHGIDAFDVDLVAGERFDPEDVAWREGPKWPNRIIVSQALASRMYPDEGPAVAVGRTVSIADSPATIIGIIEKLQAPWTGSQMVEQSVLVPQRQDSNWINYFIRTDPGQRDRLMPQIEDLLAKSNDGRIVYDMQSMDDTRKESYNIDMGLATILIFVMAILLAITGLGILGLASFNVRRRTKQIGVRRALGATKTDIFRYFMTENLIVTFSGVILGAVLTVAFNVWLVEAMNYPKIEWWGVPLGMVVLVLLGLGAVLGPANRACSISPATATRTV